MMDTIILAGGKSSRMGKNKAFLSIGKQRVIDRIVREFLQISNKVLIVTNQPEEYDNLGATILTDEEEFIGQGPLAGIRAGLKDSKADHCLVIACDMPFASKQIGVWLCDELWKGNFDAVIPSYQGRLHPLFGAYKTDIHSKIRSVLEANKRRMIGLLDQLHIKVVEQHDAPQSLQKIWEKSFWNMNTMEDYKQALKIADE